MLGDSFLKPEDAIESWDVRPGDKIADFGCGAGFFTIPIAQRVGPQGMIYAIDVRQEALDATKTKIKLFRLSNINLIRADLESPRASGIKDEGIDKIIITNILFQADDKNAILREAFRVLKQNGTLFLIEWNEDSKTGPVLPNKINRGDVEKLCRSIGFVMYKNFYAGSHHYGLIFKKP
ncbi:MAG: class I SAM-dependent methyltransferase [Patescibacteria group bacterium]